MNQIIDKFMVILINAVIIKHYILNLYYPFMSQVYNKYYFLGLINMQGGFGGIYKQIGVQKYYKANGDQYSNPHKYDIERLIRKKLCLNNKFIKPQHKILDLGCGSGQITLVLQQLGYKNIEGVDPYTHTKYQQNTGISCKSLTFLDILNGGLDECQYDVIIASYCLHLVKESMMHDFCHKLLEISKMLIIVSPTKCPKMQMHYGWKEIENSVMDRIHFRVYVGQNHEK